MAWSAVRSRWGDQADGRLLMLPIAFGGLLSALAMILVGSGLAFRDGVAVVLGAISVGLALLATAGSVPMAGAYGSERICRWVSI